MDDTTLKLILEHIDTKLDPVIKDVDQLTMDVRELRDSNLRGEPIKSTKAEVKGGAFGAGFMGIILAVYEYVKHKEIF